MKTSSAFRESMIKGSRRWMPRALECARVAGLAGDVPVGAIIIRDGEILSESGNRVEAEGDPTAHAEIVSIRAACQAVGSKWLSEAIMYVTLEPCPMCAGALLLARVRGLVFGALDPKTGAVRSRRAMLEDPRSNHQLEVISGVEAEACAEELSAFFRSRRQAGQADSSEP